MFEIDVLDGRILFMKVGVSCRVDQIGRVAVI